METIYIKVETHEEMPTEKGYYFTDCGLQQFDKSSEILNYEWQLIDWWFKPIDLEQEIRLAFAAGDKYRLFCDKWATGIATEGLPSLEEVHETMHEDAYINSLKQKLWQKSNQSK